VSAILVGRKLACTMRSNSLDGALYRVTRPLILGLALAFGTSVQAAEPVHGISKYGDLKYPADFTHFDALKGGSVKRGTLGSYDNLNPFILKGVSAIGASGIYDTLLVSSADEATSAYGLIAESIEVADDIRSVIFNLRTEARWHDGQALTAEDVVWTFDTIKEKGHPAYKSYFSAVAKAEMLDTHRVKFHFSEGNNSELPLLFGSFPVLPKHFWADRDFEKTTLDPLLGSGPYRFGKIDAGRSISYERVEDYWAKDLPVNVGQNNFAEFSYQYFRDQTVSLQALKAGDLDFRLEYTSKSWKTEYDFPALEAGHVIKEELPDLRIQRMQAWVFNTRLPKFSDPRVRQAIGYAFDFEWMNKNLFYGAYERLYSYFHGSDFMATGVPEGDELALLENYRDQLPASVFDNEFTQPINDGSGNIRKQYRKALKLFKEAGWAVKDGKMTNLESGEVMNIELVIAQPSVEKLGIAYRKTLERLGIDFKVRVVDSSQYEKRVEDFDYDMLVLGWAQQLSPGAEIKSAWSSEAADEPGSANYPGIKNPVVDALIKKVIEAPNREELVTATKALDRVLLHNHYVIPQYFAPTYRVAYKNKFKRPEIAPKSILGVSTWWIDPDMEAKLP